MRIFAVFLEFRRLVRKNDSFQPSNINSRPLNSANGSDIGHIFTLYAYIFVVVVETEGEAKFVSHPGWLDLDHRVTEPTPLQWKFWISFKSWML